MDVRVLARGTRHRDEAAARLQRLTAGDILLTLAPTSAELPPEVAEDPNWLAPMWMCEVVNDDAAESDSWDPNVAVYWLACGRSSKGRMAGNWYKVCIHGTKFGHCRKRGCVRQSDTIERKSIRLTELKLNKNGALNASGGRSSRTQVAEVLSAMRAVAGNIPADWVPAAPEATRAPNKGKRNR